MRYFKYIPIDIVNGPGTRCTLFVTGCPHHCPHCYNQATWSFTGGFSFDESAEPGYGEQSDRIISDLKDTRVRRRGLSLSGGEPMHPCNAPALLQLARRVRAESPESDIWIWTGYRMDELESPVQQELAMLADVVIDGRFEIEKKDVRNLWWRGSSNQTINVNKKYLKKLVSGLDIPDAIKVY